MSFITAAFLLFLTAAGLLYYVLPKAVRPFFLLVCSYLFYLYDAANIPLIWALLGGTAVTYAAGLALDAIPRRSAGARKAVLAGTLAVCLGALVYFKYTRFFVSLFSTDAAQGLHIVAPLGISYFTFSSLSYVIDVYRGKLRAERDFFCYALFVSFFPCIVAGPIERAGNMIPQFNRAVTFDYSRVAGGMFRILWGLFKKLVIANALYSMLRTVVGHPEAYPGPILLLAALAFSYYLYCDFSALSDVAIGTAAVFGFTVMENFSRPLAARSITDLWRRWHNSLTGWFREYLYFPLGGSRKGKVRTYVNTLLVFTVSGLWHGASLGYLVWGLLNGVFLCVEKATEHVRRRLAFCNPLYRVKWLKHFWQTLVTYVLFSAAMVFFFAELLGKNALPTDGLATALYLLGHIFTGWSGADAAGKLAALGLAGAPMWALFGSIVVVEWFEAPRIPANVLIRKVPAVLRWPLYWGLVLMILFFANFGVTGFAYQAY